MPADQTLLLHDAHAGVPLWLAPPTALFTTDLQQARNAAAGRGASTAAVQQQQFAGRADSWTAAASMGSITLPAPAMQQGVARFFGWTA
jgi:hypothetical protein